MKDFIEFQEATTNTAWMDVGSKPLTPCDLASMPWKMFINFTTPRYFDASTGVSMVKLKKPDESYDDFTKRCEAIIDNKELVVKKMRQFFGSDLRYQPKNQVFQFFNEMLKCPTRQAWTKPAKDFVFRGKVMLDEKIVQIQGWKKRGQFMVATAPYTSDYPMQSWSTNFHKASMFALDGKTNVDWSNEQQGMKLGTVPVIIKTTTNDTEWLFTSDATDFIKKSCGLNYGLAERETIRLSRATITAEYMISKTAYSSMIRNINKKAKAGLAFKEKYKNEKRQSR